MEVNNLSAIFRVISFFFFQYKFDCMLCVVCDVFYFIFFLHFFLSSFFDSYMMLLLLPTSRLTRSLSLVIRSTHMCIYVCVRRHCIQENVWVLKYCAVIYINWKGESECDRKTTEIYTYKVKSPLLLLQLLLLLLWCWMELFVVVYMRNDSYTNVKIPNDSRRIRRIHTLSYV